jgi:thiosulfate/3-mercaptopyruvate sulfurtransferase
MRLSTALRHAGLAVLCLSFGAALAGRPAPPSPAVPADDAIPSAQLMPPEELVPLLGKTGADKPLVLQVGPHVFYAEAHPPGAEYAGPGNQESGLQALRDRVKTLPHDRFIVLYCGCCPWKKCPNVHPAYQQLTSLGFHNVKVMYIADNFGKDWVAKGYPVEKGR